MGIKILRSWAFTAIKWSIRINSSPLTMFYFGFPSVIFELGARTNRHQSLSSSISNMQQPEIELSLIFGNINRSSFSRNPVELPMNWACVDTSINELLCLLRDDSKMCLLTNKRRLWRLLKLISPFDDMLCICRQRGSRSAPIPADNSDSIYEFIMAKFFDCLVFSHPTHACGLKWSGRRKVMLKCLTSPPGLRLIWHSC